MLKDGIDEDCKTLLKDLAEEYHFSILAMEVMPDHIHAIISIEKNMCRGEQCSPDGRDLPENESVNLSRVIKQMKGIITKEIGFSIWQKSYYDHVIRNEIEYARIWQYIEENPIKRLMGKSGRNDLTFLD